MDRGQRRLNYSRLTDCDHFSAPQFQRTYFFFFKQENFNILPSNKSFSLNEIVPPMSKKSLDFAMNPVIFDKKSGSYLLTKNELFSVTAIPIKHTVFCLGYIIQESKQRGK